MRRLAPLIVAFSVTAVACGDDGAAPDGGNPDATTEEGVVETTGGAVRGVRDGDTWAYLGIPYAAPPVGPLRFAPPAAPEPWAGIRDAGALGPWCPQLQDGAYVGDEDCLFVNVWVPDAGADRPVMVWIHGGGNSIGSASDPIYGGGRLAESGEVVVVTINYRLGQLGWLAHPDLGEGNWGLLDQVAALRWARANAAAFGGDPDNVTIFGESAGGRNVCTLLATPDAAGLFDRAIVQSGACKFLESLAEAEAQGAAVAGELGCTGDVAACLRAATAEEVVNALPSDVGTLGASLYGPVIDGDLLPEQPEAAIRGGRHHAVPLLVGANADETNREAPLGMTQPQVDTIVRTTFGTTLGDAILAEYAAITPPRAQYVKLTSDYRFICPSREIARAVSLGQDEAARRYFFRYAPTAAGAVHGLDVVYVFGTFDAVPYVPTATDLALSASIQGLWTTFAKSGDPGDDWPAWDDADPALVLDATIAVEPGAGADHCDFWRPIYEAL
jgi:para-nitrobenzyl esterase